MVKYTQTVRRLLLTNCLRGSNHFLGLALKGLMQSATLKALPTCLFADLAEDLKGNQSTEKRPKLVFLGGLNVVQVSMDFEIFSEGL